MARNIMMLALVGALVVSQAQASLYMDASFDMFEGMKANIADYGSYIKWAIYSIYWGLTPLIAPIIGGIVYNWYRSSNIITYEGNSFEVKELLSILGLNNETQTFNFLLSFVPKAGLGILDGMLSTTMATFTDSEKAFCDALGFTDCAFM